MVTGRSEQWIINHIGEDYKEQLKPYNIDSIYDMLFSNFSGCGFIPYMIMANEDIDYARIRILYDDRVDDQIWVPFDIIKDIFPKEFVNGIPYLMILDVTSDTYIFTDIKIKKYNGEELDEEENDGLFY